ncbi:MAG: DUF1015 family protein [Acidimicrobiia bacterium]|nr:MAG: DUF1015 family protein [Acidimicrobiia bacterium]
MLVDQKLAPHVVVSACDQLSAADRQRILSENPLSFLNAIRLPEDYSADDDREPDRHLQDSITALRGMVRKGVFRRVGRSAFFIHRLTAGAHQQTAVVAEIPITAYNHGLVLRHEDTRIEQQSDLGRYIDIVKAGSSPVCLTYRQVPAIDDIVGSATVAQPELNFVDSSGTRHEVWQIADTVLTSRLVDLFRDVPTTYIADGHHRVAAAAHSGTRDTFMAALFPTNQMHLVAYHRCIRDLGSMTPLHILQKLRESFDVTTHPVEDEPPPPARGVISMCLHGRWHQISLKAALRSELPWEDIDVITLQHRVLEPVLGIVEPRSDPRLAYVTSQNSAETIADWINAGIYEAAFLLHPPSLEELMAVSDSGRTLPPKSTWFTPKAGAGIFLRFDDP